MAASTSACDAPLRQPIPAMIMASPTRIASPASPARQPVLPPTASARETAMRVSVAAERGMTRDQQRLRLERHGVGDEPPARAERRNCGVEHARLARAAADEDRIRRGEAGTAPRAHAPSMTSSPGTPSAAALRLMRAARSARASMAMARMRGVREHPLDRRPSPSRRRRPTATVRAAAQARTALPRGSRAW